jgi:hypothetical protein
MGRTRAWKRSARSKSRGTQGAAFERRQSSSTTTAALSDFPIAWVQGPTSLNPGGLLTSDATASGAFEGPASSEYAQSFAELAHRVVERGVEWRLSPSYFVVGWLFLIGWLFITDNYAGKVDDWPGIINFAMIKGVFVTLVFVLGIVLLALVRRFEEESS